MPTASARFTTAYTDAQKDAVLRSVLVNGRTVAETIRMAKAGELGLPAFEVGKYAYQIVERGRDQYEAANEDALTLAVDDELRGAELDALATIRAIRQDLAKDGRDNLEPLRKATQDLTAIRKARRDANPQRSAPKRAIADVNTADEPRETTSVVTDLLATVSKGARSGSLSDARTPPPAA